MPKTPTGEKATPNEKKSVKAKVHKTTDKLEKKSNLEMVTAETKHKAEAKSENVSEVSKSEAVHSEKHKTKSESHKAESKINFFHHWFFWWPKAVITLIILSIVLTGAAFWINLTPEYVYYSFYQAVKTKKYPELTKYIEFYTIADNVLEDQKVFFGANTDFEYARFDIRAKVEYTFLKYLQDGTLEQLLPSNPDKWQDIYNNKEVKKDGNKKFVIDLKSIDKPGITGIGGYQTIIFELNGTWKMTKLSRNPQLEQDKDKLSSTQNTPPVANNTVNSSAKPVTSKSSSTSTNSVN
jgi:hypothetical protein